jgi:hypothetical protein
MKEKELIEIKKTIQKHLQKGVVKVFNSDDGIEILCFVPERGDLTRRSLVMDAINSSNVIDKFNLDHFSVMDYKSEKDWIVPKVSELVRRAIRPAQSMIGDFNTEILISLRDSHISIEILAANLRKPGVRDKLKECIKRVYGEIKRISATEHIYVSISGGDTMYSGIMHSQPSDDYDDDPVNPNWPSTTGNPSGGGRGNNPPGSK